ADRVLQAARGRQLALERVMFRAEDELPGHEDALECVLQLAGDGSQVEVDEWNRLLAGRQLDRGHGARLGSHHERAPRGPTSERASLCAARSPSRSRSRSL